MVHTAPNGANGSYPNDARSAAERYIRERLSPIKLPYRSKNPNRRGWEGERLTAEDLDHWFPRGVRLNIGVLNGEPSGNTADADCDCPEARAAAPLLLPPTGWRFGGPTAKGGHHIYRTDEPLSTAAVEYFDPVSKVKILELRGTGGQTVFPPSTHQETGEPIEWEAFTEPATIPLAKLRDMVDELAACTLLARHWPGPDSECRQRTFLALAGALHRAGRSVEWSERFIRALAVATNDEEADKRVRCAQQAADRHEQDRKTYGWPTLWDLLGKHGRDLCEQVRKWLGIRNTTGPKPTFGSGGAEGKATTSPGPRKARTLAPYTPFPTDALPAPLAEYVRQCAVALGTEPAYVALPVLAVVASAINNTRTIRIKRGWEEPCIVWSAIVGDSGTLKSPAYLKAVSYLFRLQKQKLDEYRVKAAEYQEELAAYKAKKKAFKESKETAEDPGDPPEAPVLNRVVCSDTTIEKLAEILEDNPRGTLVARDELAGWLGSFSRYKAKGASSDLPNWLEMFRSGTVIVDRKTGERRTLFIPRAAVCVTGSIQPGVLAHALTPEFLDSGLAARILMAMPPKKAKQWSEVEVAPEAEDAYRAVLDKLLALEFDTRDGERCAHALDLSRAAKAVWVRFYDEWAHEQAGAEGEIAAALSKLEAYTGRFALIHHVVSRVAEDADDLTPVSPASVEAGIALVRWFGAEARRIYAMLSETAEERDRRRLVEWIRTHGGRCTVKQLQRSNSRKYPTKEEAEQALDALVEAGDGRWDDLPPGPKGGRPTRVFILATAPDETDETDETGPDNDGGGPTPPDETPPVSDDTPPNAGDFGVSSVSSVVGKQYEQSESPTDSGPEVSSDGLGVSSDAPTGKPGPGRDRPFKYLSELESPGYVLVADAGGVDSVRAGLEDASGERVYLDTETTGLDPQADRVRLLSLSVPAGESRAVYLIDCFAVSPAPLWEALAGCEIVGHNLAFDLQFLARLGFRPGPTTDTMLLAAVEGAGTGAKVNLAACAEKYLGKSVNKDEQTSDWAGTLTPAQLAYAADDVRVLEPLAAELTRRTQDARLDAAATIECRALPALAWMTAAGVAFDVEGWKRRAANAEQAKAEAAATLDRLAPERSGQIFADSWEWSKAAHIAEALALLGHPVEDTRDGTLAGIDHPFAAAVREYRACEKQVSSYGTDWLRHVGPDGRIRAKWWQIGAASGRMACSDPNLQQVPRDDSRKCFTAGPGNVLVKCDYSQIELRIAARITEDAALLAAYQRGDDLHALTAKAVLGAKEVTKADRQLAKAVNFGLLFGMGTKGFQAYAKAQYGLDLATADAERYRAAFFQTYGGLRAWHQRTRNTVQRLFDANPDGTHEVRTLAGRRRVLKVAAKKRGTDDKPYPNVTEALNTPVQGTGADGLKLALALLWERRNDCPSAFPVLAVHDEIVLEVPAADAAAATDHLKRCMIDAIGPLIDPVPVEVEAKTARTWGGD